MRIVLAEDDPASALVMKKRLQRAGHDVMCADNGAQAWDLVISSQFDLLITDLMMPVMGGEELIRRVLTSKPRAAIIIVSGSPDEARAILARYPKSDMVFLLKPVDDEDVGGALSTVLENRRADQQSASL